MDATTLVNGQLASKLDVQDRGLAYGDGVFETMALVQGQVQLWPGHRQRLMTGLMTLGLVIDKASAGDLINVIIGDIKAAYALFGYPKGVIKVTVTRGSGGRGYAAPSVPRPTRIVSMLPWPQGRSQLSTGGVCVRMCQHRWSSNVALAGMKHLNRLDQVLARNEWTDATIHEGIMLNQEGRVISGVMSNIFIQMDDQLITPQLDQCGINGTMAQAVKAIAQQCGIGLIERQVEVDTLLNAEAAFFTNSINGIWPVVALLPYSPPASSASKPSIPATRWPISPLILQLQQALALHLSEQLAVGDLC
jgi:4-amino-4-deoxychorismate lyase|tara:strand:+ start:1065 stop:1982 length:918 start_codon:yes stop_codon:yes gene_type:complete